VLRGTNFETTHRLIRRDTCSVAIAAVPEDIGVMRKLFVTSRVVQYRFHSNRTCSPHRKTHSTRNGGRFARNASGALERNDASVRPTEACHPIACGSLTPATADRAAVCVRMQSVPTRLCNHGACMLHTHACNACGRGVLSHVQERGVGPTIMQRRTHCMRLVVLQRT
jgi:hypothetical protein